MAKMSRFDLDFANGCCLNAVRNLLMSSRRLTGDLLAICELCKKAIWQAPTGDQVNAIRSNGALIPSIGRLSKEPCQLLQ